MSARATRVASRPADRVRLPLVLAVLLVAALTGACGAAPSASSDAIVGTGVVTTELRDLAPFTRVSVGAGMKVVIGEADAQQVMLDAQANLLPAIETKVDDGQLIVTVAPPGIATTEGITLTLRMTRVESVALSGGAVGYVEHTGEALKLDVSGGAQLTGIGDTTELTLTASSGSHARLGELAAERAEVDLNDGASVELHAITSVTGTADGGATLTLTAKPQRVDVETRSGASVQGG